MTSCNGMYTGSEFARHESEQTSYPGASLREILLNRFYERRQMTAIIAGALSADTIKRVGHRKLECIAKLAWFSAIEFHMCLVGWLLDCVRFTIRAMDIVHGSQSSSRQVFQRVVRYRPLKGLSRMMGNYHVRFLGGEGP